MLLTQTFNFSHTKAPIFMEYYAWYDLEPNWDFVYLLISEDGKNWEQLKPDHCNQVNDTGSNLGCGYTGNSGGWFQEKVDLSAYAGKKVTVQFEYLTDAALHGEGFLLDDLSIKALGYETDFEDSDGGWTAQGFVRIMNLLPQIYRVALLQRNVSGTFVERYEVKGSDPLLLSFDDDQAAYLMVSATTRNTDMLSFYSLKIQK